MAEQLDFSKVDINAFRSTKAYNDMISQMRQNPMKFYRMLQVYSEVPNALSINTKGRELLRVIQNDIGLTPQQIEQGFTPPVIPENVKPQIDQQVTPEYYKKLFNDYMYGEHGSKEKFRLRQMKQIAEESLRRRGIDPASLVEEQSPVWSALEWAGNLVSLPGSAITYGATKLTGKDPDKFRSKGKGIWGYSWIDALKTLGANEEMKTLVEKRVRGIPLTPDEEKKLGDYEWGKFFPGLALDIVADPLNAIGLVMSPITKAKTAKKLFDTAESTTLLKSIAKGSQELLQVLPDTPKTANYIKRVEAIRNTTREEKIISKMDELSAYVKTLSDSPEKLKLINKYDKLKTALQGIRESKVKELTDVGNFLRESGNIKSADKVLKALDKYNDNFKRYQKLMDNSPFSKYVKWSVAKDEKLRNLRSNIIEKTPFRKMFVSQVPLNKPMKIITREGKEKIINVSSDARDTVRRMERLGKGRESKYGKAIVDYDKELKKLKTSVDQFRTMSKADFDETVFSMMENVKLIDDYTKVYNAPKQLLTNVVAKGRTLMNDFLIDEIKDGANILPKMSGDMRNQFVKWSTMLRKTIAKNPMSTKVASLEDGLRTLLNMSADYSPTYGILGSPEDSIAYFTRLLTPEAKVIFDQLKSSDKDLIRKFIAQELVATPGQVIGTAMEKAAAPGFRAKGVISNLSRKARGSVGTVSDINKLILENADKPIVLYGGKAPIESDVLSKFKGVKFFNTDPLLALATRASRAITTSKQITFYNSIKKFGSKKPVKGWEQVRDMNKLPFALQGMWFHPDIIESIKTVYEFTKSDSAANIFMQFFSSLNKFWQASTLSIAIATAVRNALGNIMNSFVIASKYTGQDGIKRIGKTSDWLATSYKDAIVQLIKPSAMKGKTAITDTGEMIKYVDEINKAIDLGVLDSTFLNSDLYKSVLEEYAKKAGIKKETLAESIVNIPGKLAQQAAKVQGLNSVMVANNMVEQTSKYGLYLYLRKRGLTPEKAADEVFRGLFDYGDLTNLERKIKVFVPFYKWIKSNIVFQVGNFGSPTSRTMLKLYRGTQKEQISEQGDVSKRPDLRYMPEYFKEGAMINLSKWSKALPEYLNLEGYLPFFDVAKLIRIGKGITTGNVLNLGKSTWDEIIKDWNPIMRSFIEAVSNKNLRYGGDLKRSERDVATFLGKRFDPRIVNFLQIWRPLTLMERAGVKIGDASSVKQDGTFSRFMLSYLIGNVNEYNLLQGRRNVTYKESGELNNDIQNFRRYYQNLMTRAVMNGRDLNENDHKYLEERFTGILLDINQAYTDGKITSKSREYLNKALLASAIYRRPK